MRFEIGLIAALGVVPGIAAAQDVPAAQAGAPKTTSPTRATPADEATDEPDIIVRGTRTPPGSVIGDITPDQVLGPADIRSYGVSTIADLLNELSPQTTSGRGSGAPVVLLNGRRISSFAEIRDIPTEAIARAEILPEEVALKYGYRADQKVVNIVLRRRFRAATPELNDTFATAGGRNTPQGQIDLLQIARDKRLNLHVNYTESSALTEAERDIAPVAGTTFDGVDQRPYRTLLPSARDFSTNAVLARNIFGTIGATLNARIEATQGVGDFGLPTVALTVPATSPFAAAGTGTVMRTLGTDPLTQTNEAITYHAGTTFNGDLGHWRWSLTGNYDRVDSKTFTATGFDASAYQARLNAGDPTANPRGPLNVGDFDALGVNSARSTSNVGGADALFNGTLFDLPAGAIGTSVRVGASASDFTSRSYRAGLTQSDDVSRDIVNGQVNIDVPITSRSKNFLSAVGNLSANFNLAEDHLSDFGTLQTLGYGANWSPIEALRFLVSHTDQDEAPTAAQLGNPQVTTPNVRVFDYIAGTTATVTTLTGGNPNLVADDRHVTKISMTLKPWKAKDLTLTADYVASRIENPIASFPSATAAIEAAFPGRFTRDADGQLLRVDSRPINFAESRSSQLRWGINFSHPLKSKIQKEIAAFRAGLGPNPFAGLNFPGRPGERGPGGEGPPPGGGPGGAPGGGGPGGGGPGGGGPGGGGGRGFGGGGGGPGGRGGQGGGRIQFAVYHTWHFTDRVLVQQGGPSLDLLNGDTVGSGGGQARHEVEGQAGITNNGLGARLSVNYASGTRVNGGTTAAPETLNFGGLATANLRLFADLGQRLDLLKAHPWVRGMRLSLSVENILDSRQRVTDATGATPVSYQPDYLDPLGRTVRFTIRKLFF